jgi:hypothetical protein
MSLARSSGEFQIPHSSRSIASKGHSASVLFAGWLALLFLLVSVQTAAAHTEGKMQLSAQPAGPFKMTVFTSPDPAVIGEIHVAALVFMAEDARPVLDAEVFVQIQPSDGGGSTENSEAVLGDAENKLLYEAMVDVSKPGSYLVTVTIEDSEGQTGDASFELEVSSQGGFNWLLLIPVVIAGILLAIVLFKRARSQSASQAG